MSDAAVSDDAGAPGLVPLRLDGADFGALLLRTGR